MPRIIDLGLMATTALLLAACSTPAPSGRDAPGAARPAAVAPAATSSPATTGRAIEFPGFRRVVRDDREYFCQTRAVTGSRARTMEICLDREQMKQMEAQSEEYRRAAGISGSQGSLQLDSPR